MAYAPFHITIRGADRLHDVLKAIKDTAENKIEQHQIIATELWHATERAFEAKADPETGSPWADWSPRYEKHLRKLGQASRANMLQRQRSEAPLYDAIMWWGDEAGAHIGANKVYARIHQLGGGDVRPGYPARPYMGLDKEALDDIRDIIVERITAASRR